MEVSLQDNIDKIQIVVIFLHFTLEDDFFKEKCYFFKNKNEETLIQLNESFSRPFNIFSHPIENHKDWWRRSSWICRRLVEETAK